MIPDHSTRRHEAAHCAAAVWVGGRPVECVRVDEPEVGILGKVSTDRTRELAPEDLLYLLIGYIADPDPGIDWPPAWGPRRDAEIGDERGLAALVDHLDLDEAQYVELIEEAKQLLEEPRFQRLLRLISGALHAAPVLDAESVQVLAKAAGIEGGTQCGTCRQH